LGDFRGRWQLYNDAKIWFLLRSSRSRAILLQTWLAPSGDIQEASDSNSTSARSDRTILLAMKQPHPALSKYVHRDLVLVASCRNPVNHFPHWDRREAIISQYFFLCILAIPVSTNTILTRELQYN
jgi:hypothetical protein